MRVDEIAPDIFRLSLFVPEMKIQFNQFLVRDEEPLLFHTGMRQIFPEVREAVAQVIDPATLRWIGSDPFISAAPQAASRTGFRPSPDERSRCPGETPPARDRGSAAQPAVR